MVYNTCSDQQSTESWTMNRCDGVECSDNSQCLNESCLYGTCQAAVQIEIEPIAITLLVVTLAIVLAACCCIFYKKMRIDRQQSKIRLMNWQAAFD